MRAFDTKVLARYFKQDEPKADFSDYYLRRANQRDGAPQTPTFDKALRGGPCFRVLPT
jgi:predicted nucleic-acid-binding protein